MSGIQALKDRIGEELGVSTWMPVSQDRIDRFAHCTEDRQWIHVEPRRAAQEGPFGGTIAHGFLTLSLLTALQESARVLPPDLAAMQLNYGLEKVRFLNPVRSGARVRNRVRLAGLEARGSGHVVSLDNIVEIEGEAKPALVATMLIMLVGEPAAAESV